MGCLINGNSVSVTTGDCRWGGGSSNNSKCQRTNISTYYTSAKETCYYHTHLGRAQRLDERAGLAPQRRLPIHGLP